MSKEVMRQALEALEHCKDVIVERGLNGNLEFAKKWGLTLPLERSESAITALREALAEQPAQQCKWPTCQSEEYQQALAEQIRRELVGEQPAQQEPVAWRWVNSKNWLTYGEMPHDKFESTPLYTSQTAQQEPVALFKWLPEGATHIGRISVRTAAGGSLAMTTHAFKYDSAVLKVYVTDNDNEYPGWRDAKDCFFHLNFPVLPLYTPPQPAQRTWVGLTDGERQRTTDAIRALVAEKRAKDET